MKTTFLKKTFALAMVHSSNATVSSLLSAVGKSKPSFVSNLQHAHFAPPVNVHNTSQAIPTNTWWGNLIHADKTSPDSPMQPIWSNPYALRVYPSGEMPGIHVFYPYETRHVGGSSENEGAARFYLHGQVIEAVLSSTEIVTAQASTFEVMSWDDVGVSVQFTCKSANDAVMISTFVSGMAFITAEYTDMHGMILSPYEVRSLAGDAKPVDGTLYSLSPGKPLVVEYFSGGMWGVFSTVPVILKYVQATNSLESTSLMNGALRVTRMMDATEDFGKYANCIIKGASLEMESEKNYGWTFNTEGECTSGLLHYALHHHMASMVTSDRSVTTCPELNRTAATRGVMTAVVTKPMPTMVWRFNEPTEIDLGFYPTLPIDVSLAKSLNLADQLSADINSEWVTSGDSYYFTGKKVQMYASLCIMASDTNVISDNGTLLEKCISKLRAAMCQILDNTLSHPLVYDEIYRGLISSESFNKNDLWRDFGNSMYNDHHYHYGYWIVAGSILRKLDPSWERMPQLILTIEYLIRDVANPDDINDVWFPRFRHFDWFLGHSYSHGISPFADGKDQESTSEDINFDYGMMLWGQISGKENMESLAKLMMKVNSRAIQTYFLMTDDNPIHPAEIVRNKVTGIFFDNKVKYETWFSPHRHCIHGIQMIPVSLATKVFRSRTFVHEEWEQIISKLPIIADVNAQDPWQSLLYANYATINKTEALKKLQVVPMDDGLARAWALYVAATRAE